jgi:hypothetical protein
MEASEATAQQGAEGAQANGGEAPEAGQAQEQQTPDIGQVVERFDELDRSLGDRLERLEGVLQPGESEQEYGQEGQYGLEGQEGPVLFDEQGNPYDQYGQPLQDPGLGQADPQQLVEHMRGELQQEMQQQLAPILEHFNDQQIAKVEEQYPELKDRQVAERVMQSAEEKATAFGNPELMFQPGFVEAMYLAQKAQEMMAGQETPAGADNEAQLESGAVSNPGTTEPSEADRIVQAGQSGKKFWA